MASYTLLLVCTQKIRFSSPLNFLSGSKKISNKIHDPLVVENIPSKVENIIKSYKTLNKSCENLLLLNLTAKPVFFVGFLFISFRENITLLILFNVANAFHALIEMYIYCLIGQECSDSLRSHLELLRYLNIFYKYFYSLNILILNYL